MTGGVLAGGLGLLVLLLAWSARWAAAGGRAARLRTELGVAGHPVVPGWAGLVVGELGLPGDPGAWWSGAVLAAGLGVVVLAAVASALVAIVVGLGSVVAVVLAPRWARRRDAMRFEAALPEFLDEVARALRSGRSLRQAVAGAGAATAAPLGPEALLVVRRAERGAALGAALDAWATDRASPALTLVVAALELGESTGGSLAGAVDGIAATLRDRQALAGEVRALATQARASATVLVVAPLGFAAVAAAADPRTAHFLTRTLAGVVCVATGLGLDAAGAWWMRRLTDQVR